MSELMLMENPQIAALLRQHAEEQAATNQQVETEQVAEEERMYLFRGELYAPDDLPKVCPYLGSLSLGDRTAIMSSYEYHGTKSEPVEVPIDHPKTSVLPVSETTQTELPVAVEGNTTGTAVETELESTQDEIQVSEFETHSPVVEVGGASNADETEIAVVTKSRATILPQSLPVSKAVIAYPVSAAAVAEIAQVEAPEALKLPDAKIVPETLVQPDVIEQSDATNVPLTQEVQGQVLPQASVVENIQPMIAAPEYNTEFAAEPINLEVLAEDEPQLAQTFAAIAEHSGVEMLEKPSTSMMSAETIESVSEYMQTAEPEKAMAVEAITILIETAANRLTTLVQREELNETEAAAIVEFIVEWYAELAQRGVNVNEQTAYEFVTIILQEAGINAEEVQQKLIDWQEGTREMKLQHQRSLVQVVGINTESRSGRWPLGWMYALVT